MKPVSLSDWFAAHALFVRYTASLDACDVDAVVDCFTEDGWLESPVCELARSGDGWKFATRTVHMDQPFAPPDEPIDPPFAPAGEPASR